MLTSSDLYYEYENPGSFELHSVDTSSRAVQRPYFGESGGGVSGVGGGRHSADTA